MVALDVSLMEILNYAPLQNGERPDYVHEIVFRISHLANFPHT